MTNYQEHDFERGFRAYLLDAYKGDEARTDEVLTLADGLLPGFMRQVAGPDFRSLYAVTEVAPIEAWTKRILTDSLLMQENRSLDGINYMAVLTLYRRFLRSHFSPTYVGKEKPAPVPGEKELPQTEQPVTPDLHEGAEVHAEDVTLHERNPEARAACIAYFRRLHGGRLVCECCGFDFERAYKGIGRDFIEVHHRYPVSQRGGDYVVNPETDLVPLCSNCHSMIHRTGGQGDCMSLDDLRRLYTGPRYH